VKRLFELEVPELQDGVVELKAVAREPGHRTKIAVASNDSNVDPVGACVGARGLRVRQVVNELRGEKVDIVPFVDNASELVMKALAPAKVREVRIHEDTGIAEVIVPDFQLSLAIGKEGQNARLAARLTGWRVDIKSETQLAEEESGEFFAEGEWVEGPDGELMWKPADGEAISAAEAGYAGATAADAAAAAAAEAEKAAAQAATQTDAAAATDDGAGAATEASAEQDGEAHADATGMIATTETSDEPDGAADGAAAAAENSAAQEGEANADATVDAAGATTETGTE
jgi:N utilization substance protein A